MKHNRVFPIYFNMYIKEDVLIVTGWEQAKFWSAVRKQICTFLKHVINS